MTTVLIDYESGNLHSAQKAFERMAAEVGAGEVIVTSDPDAILAADRVVLPGDGAFPACVAALDASGCRAALEEAVITRGRPFLGICVGMQLMASLGREYRDTPGLGWIEGEVVRIDAGDQPVPHMGWNDLVLNSNHPVFAGVETGHHTYFVHSYHMQVAQPDNRLAHVRYGGDITAVVGRDTMIGMQFHPEKSQSTGLQMIANFLTWTP
ncbi:MAG: imidazole glycerol phosphate synthase subunit HisH [Pseudomonadota bacterium]